MSNQKINPGDIFWIAPNAANRIASDHAHPYVVVQDDASNIVIVCALTTNLKRAKEPGNVLLDESEGNLPKQSVIVVSQLTTINQVQLGEYIGALTDERINQVLIGIRFVQKMIQHHEQIS